MMRDDLIGLWMDRALIISLILVPLCGVLLLRAIVIRHRDTRGSPLAVVLVPFLAMMSAL